MGTTLPEVRLHVVGGTDTSLAGGGYIVTGAVTGSNIAMDNNETMAHDNGETSTLYLNHNGGNVAIPGHAAARIWQPMTIASQDERCAITI